MAYGFNEDKSKVEVYDKSEVYNKDEAYSKDEVYNKNDAYGKGDIVVLSTDSFTVEAGAYAQLKVYARDYGIYDLAGWAIVSVLEKFGTRSHGALFFATDARGRVYPRTFITDDTRDEVKLYDCVSVDFYNYKQASWTVSFNIVLMKIK